MSSFRGSLRRICLRLRMASPNLLFLRTDGRANQRRRQCLSTPYRPLSVAIVGVTFAPNSLSRSTSRSTSTVCRQHSQVDVRPEYRKRGDGPHFAVGVASRRRFVHNRSLGAGARKSVPLILNLVTEGEISCPLLHTARCRLASWPPLNLSRQLIGLRKVLRL